MTVFNPSLVKLYDHCRKTIDEKFMCNQYLSLHDGIAVIIIFLFVSYRLNCTTFDVLSVTFRDLILPFG